MTVKNIRGMRVALAFTAVLVLTGTFAGCLWSPELARVQQDLERQLPGARFEKDFAISLGPMTLGLARAITGMVPDAREASGYLKHVKRIQVAVYNASSMPAMNTVRMPKQLKQLQERAGWETAVRVRDENEIVWIMYKIDGDRIRDLLVVCLSDDELVMVKASGTLDALVARALSETDGVTGIPEIRDEYEGDWRDEFGG
jgi:hypothetical protein